MSDPIVSFSHFGFQYTAQSSPTLYDITFDVHPGEKVLIAGPSGCGKSTLAHAINGLIPFSYNGEMTGSLKVNGKETRDMSIFDISHTVGTVLQDQDGQFIGLTVAEDIAFALENDNVPTSEMHELVRDIATSVSIETHLSYAPSDLSGGQKQRVSLAGVMVDNVSLLLFDEPLANLDPATGKQAIELIDEMQKRTGAAVIIIEHRIEDVLWRDVDRVILMGEGHILADTTPDELLSSPLLIENGVREPLYIAALKYAGVDITPEMLPRSIRTLSLSEEQKDKVRAWYHAFPPAPPKEEANVLLDVKDLTFRYTEEGRTVLKGVSFQIREGELLALVGKNGAGKSTLAKLLCGFEKPVEGVISLAGEDLSPLSIKERADRIGYVMQNPNQMISKVMIFDEVALGLRTRSVLEEEVKRRVEETLKICGLWPFRNWPVSALSYGQKKRVTIASILVLRPKLILLDEPTAGQDYRRYTDIMEFLASLNAAGVTCILITHDMHLMLEYAPRALVLTEGELLADESSAAVLTDPVLVEKANLKETSLYSLALACGIPDGQSFVERFIAHEKEVRSK